MSDRPTLDTPRSEPKPIELTPFEEAVKTIDTFIPSLVTIDDNGAVKISKGKGTESIVDANILTDEQREQLQTILSEGQNLETEQRRQQSFARGVETIFNNRPQDINISFSGEISVRGTRGFNTVVPGGVLSGEQTIDISEVAQERAIEQKEKDQYSNFSVALDALQRNDLTLAVGTLGNVTVNRNGKQVFILGIGGLDQERTVEFKEILSESQALEREKQAAIGFCTTLEELYKNPTDLVIADVSGTVSRINGQKKFDLIVPSGVLTVEQRQELNDLQTVLQQQLSRFRTLLAEAVQSGDFQQLRDYADIDIRADADIQKKEQLEELIEQLQKNLETARLEKAILTKITELDGNEALGLIQILPNTSEEDNVKVARLTTKAIRANYRAGVFSIYKSLAEDKPNYGAIFNTIDTLPFDDKRQQFQGRIGEAVSAKERRELRLSIAQMAAPLGADFRQVLEAIDELPVRGDEYLLEQKNIREGIQILQRTRFSQDIRAAFRTSDAATIIARIEQFPERADQEGQLKKQLLEEYRNFLTVRRNIRPADYDIVFATEITELLDRLETTFPSRELGTNKEAMQYVRGRFRQSILPLVESFRADPISSKTMDRYVPKVRNNGKNPRAPYIIRSSLLEQQRPLTAIESQYVQSTERISSLSPYLVGVAAADIGTTQVYLENHFNKLSKETRETIQDGDYVPILYVGQGPNGINGFGELARLNPALASRTFVIDEGELPGGPFIIPRGPAWELNSANQKGTTVSLPDAPNGNEQRTVRAYGSPLRWYPGERTVKNLASRQGSINTTVDWLLKPDDLSTLRYPTNEELATVIELQSGTLLPKKNTLFQTRLINVEPADTSNGEKGNKIVTIETTLPDGSIREIRLRTDGIIYSGGLGNVNYGFPLEGSRAEKVVEEASSQTTSFPKASATLDAFRSLADRTQSPEQEIKIGKTVAIYGVGNSTDVLVEYLSGLFASGNPAVKDIERIYIIADGSPTARPRYAKIGDIRPRFGRENLVSQIRTRVSDFDYVDDSLPLEERKLVLYDEGDNVITQSDGTPLEVDTVISATGFKQGLEKTFSYYLNGQPFKTADTVVPVTLPTNPDVAVADTFVQDPSIMFIGTTAKPRFNQPKLDQLPKSSAAALVRVGPENAVAIGFIGPGVQAAIGLFLDTNSFDVPPLAESILEMEEVRCEGEVLAINTQLLIDRAVDPDDLRLQNNANKVNTVSSLLLYELQDKLVIFQPPGSNFKAKATGKVSFEVSFTEPEDDSPPKLILQPNIDIDSPLPPIEVARLIQQIFSTNEFIQRYTYGLLREKRGRRPNIRLSVGFLDGRVDPKETFVQ